MALHGPLPVWCRCVPGTFGSVAPFFLWHAVALGSTWSFIKQVWVSRGDSSATPVWQTLQQEIHNSVHRWSGLENFALTFFALGFWHWKGTARQARPAQFHLHGWPSSKCYSSATWWPDLGNAFKSISYWLGVCSLHWQNRTTLRSCVFVFTMKPSLGREFVINTSCPLPQHCLLDVKLIQLFF